MKMIETLKRLFYTLKNELRYTTYRIEKTPRRKKLGIPLVIGTIFGFVNIISSTFFHVVSPQFDQISFAIFSISLILTGGLILKFKENPFFDSPILSYPFGVIMVLMGLRLLFHIL